MMITMKMSFKKIEYGYLLLGVFPVLVSCLVGFIWEEKNEILRKKIQLNTDFSKIERNVNLNAVEK